MPTAERRAILLLLGLAVVGHGVRWLLLRPGEPPGQVQFLADNPGGAGALATQRARAAAAGRPLAEGERIDVDRAPAVELIRLPRVGPSLARVIVANRDSLGPFGSLEGLDRVPGVGPGLLRRIGPFVAFSGAAERGNDGPRERRTGRAVAEAEFGPGRPSPVPSFPRSAALLDLNTATAAELQALPGIGPAKARAIVDFRENFGRFGSVAELERVPGIGPVLVERIAGRVTTGRSP